MVSLLIPLIASVPAFANPGSLLTGEWTIDVSNPSMSDPPTSVNIVLTDIGSGRYKMKVDIVDHNGARRHQVSTFVADGTASPAVGNADYDVLSMTMPSRRILVMGAAFKGHPANTETRVLIVLSIAVIASGAVANYFLCRRQEQRPNSVE